jgi:hypothetical protein
LVNSSTSGNHFKRRPSLVWSKMKRSSKHGCGAPP